MYLAVRPRPNFALVTRGFRERVVNLCPRISDWEVGATIIIRLIFAIKSSNANNTIISSPIENRNKSK